MQKIIKNLLKDRPVLFVGLVLLFGYWWTTQPAPGMNGLLGYAEDLCSDFVRQLMGQHIKANGRPTYTTDQFMAPFGASVPFMAWGIERDWLGGHVWNWDRTFPFLWAFFGFSLFSSYFLVGWICEQMGLTRFWSWAVATLVTLFHVPRHFKIFHHYEYLYQHWTYVSLFLDAWIWQKLIRNKTWSLPLELWRGVIMIGTLCSMGYFWGVLMMEWGIVRVFGLGVFAFRLIQKEKTKIEKLDRWSFLPVTFALFFIALYIRWFPDMIAEAKKFGEIWQPVWFFADWKQFFRPLWFEKLLTPLYGFVPGFPKLERLDAPETVVAVGWVYWVPALCAINWVRRKKKGAGLILVAPFVFFTACLILYARAGWPHQFHSWVHALVPFMKFFRTASRTALFLPQGFAVITVLAWPELSQWVKKKWIRRDFRILVYAFIWLSLFEFTWLFYPVNRLPAMEQKTQNMLREIGQLPGDTVLDLPFCTAGGNGYCTSEQCNFYPKGTLPACLRLWHDKKVFGLYQARMTQEHCNVYGTKAPYQSFYRAWNANRCFTSDEWKEFCSFLDERKELSAILLYPDIWTGAGKCLDEFAKHLGPPIQEGHAYSKPSRNGGEDLVRIQWYRPKCGNLNPQ